MVTKKAVKRAAKLEIKSVEQVQHHRNGVCGAPFYAVMFTNKDGEQMVAAVFEAKHHVSVFRIPDLSDPRVGVTFGINSWRGDHYEPELREAVAEFERVMQTTI